MAEVSVSSPLTGEEIIEGICDRIRRRLRQDCFLNAVTAYESVEGLIAIEIRMRDCGRYPEVRASVDYKAGNAKAAGEPPIIITEEIKTKPPNEFRVESGQAVPVLTETQDGRREIKKVTYARPSETQDSLPENLPGESII